MNLTFISPCTPDTRVFARTPQEYAFLVSEIADAGIGLGNALNQLSALLEAGCVLEHNLDNTVLCLDLIRTEGMNNNVIAAIGQALPALVAHSASSVSLAPETNIERQQLGGICTEGLAAVARKTIETIRQWLVKIGNMLRDLGTWAVSLFTRYEAGILSQIERLNALKTKKFTFTTPANAPSFKAFKEYGAAMATAAATFSAPGKSLAERNAAFEDVQLPDLGEAKPGEWSLSSTLTVLGTAKELCAELKKKRDYDKAIDEANRQLREMVGQDEVDSDIVKALRADVATYSKHVRDHMQNCRTFVAKAMNIARATQPKKAE